MGFSLIVVDVLNDLLLDMMLDGIGKEYSLYTSLHSYTQFKSKLKIRYYGRVRRLDGVIH